MSIELWGLRKMALLGVSQKEQSAMVMISKHALYWPGVQSNSEWAYSLAHGE